MGVNRNKKSGTFISNRFAVIVIAVLFGASIAGWIATELVPPDFPARRDYYRGIWTESGARIVEGLRLYDPFHSFWFRFIAALFFVVLLMCILTRWRRLALGSWRPALPADADGLRKEALSFEFSWPPVDRIPAGSKDPLAPSAGHIDSESPGSRFVRVAALLKRFGLEVVWREGASGISFAAFSGKWRSPGTMLFHIGILAITIGGIVGSYAGWHETVFVREGQTVPFPRDSALSLRVDRFDIVTTDRLEIKDFVSTISIMKTEGGTIVHGAVEVNRPLKVAGRRIHQSEFTVDENAFERARIGYTLREGLGRGTIDLVPDSSVSIDGGAIVLAAGRFIPDFRMSPDGPFSASAFPSNPALEIEVSNAERTERGWLFLYHPDYNQPFTAPVDLVLMGCDPVYYAGLLVSSNPGALVLFAGFAVATLGLMLMYICNPRVLKGVVGPDGLVVAAAEYRWKASFEKEFAAIREAMRTEFGPRG
ncbi:MAG: cytochrome c biogenesis protein ResB [Candidatus Krumholzibacteria bacterium]|nr:cytochrome c biogenesis protein ResB [Candidatus Krumholzibacteria bacterium]